VIFIDEGDVETSRRWLVEERSMLIGWWSKREDKELADWKIVNARKTPTNVKFLMIKRILSGDS